MQYVYATKEPKNKTAVFHEAIHCLFLAHDKYFYANYTYGHSTIIVIISFLLKGNKSAVFTFADFVIWQSSSLTHNLTTGILPPANLLVAKVVKHDL